MKKHGPPPCGINQTGRRVAAMKIYFQLLRGGYRYRPEVLEERLAKTTPPILEPGPGQPRYAAGQFDAQARRRGVRPDLRRRRYVGGAKSRPSSAL
jgi:hypothetical protein